MSATEFTKGWRVDDDLIRDETAVIVACRHRTPKALWAEHARVMAASHELLEALKDMVDLHEDEPDRPAVAHALEIISKAEGK